MEEHCWRRDRNGVDTLPMGYFPGEGVRPSELALERVIWTGCNGTGVVDAIITSSFVCSQSPVGSRRVKWDYNTTAKYYKMAATGLFDDA